MTEENNVSNWFQDNLRIIISVGIVILLVFAIYSYSQRNSRSELIVDDSQVTEVAQETVENNNEINEIIDEIRDERNTEDTALVETDADAAAEAAAQAEQERIAMEEKKVEEERMAQEKAEQEARAQAEQQAEQERIAMEEKKVEEERMAQEKAAEEEAHAAEQVAREEESIAKQAAKDVVREVIESRSQQPMSKDGVVTIVAVRGDSMTTLARKATAEYIKQNNVTGLTAAHKVYIEDYMRKAVATQPIYPGTGMDFSHALLNEAIGMSRSLSGAQLNNLSRYAQNVSSL